MPTLTPNSNSLIVIVGLTGYIASHIGLQALNLGFRVRGTIRDPLKASLLRAAYEKAGVDCEKLELVTVDDLWDEAQFERAFHGADGVVNPTLPSVQGAGAEYVDKLVESILVPLRVAARTRTLKRYVLTSTMGTVNSMFPISEPPAKPLTEEDWNEEAVEQYRGLSEEERGEGKNGFLKYVAGKTLGEKAAWEFVRENKVPWEFSVVVPGLTWGPVLFESPGTSTRMIANLFKGDPTLLYSGHIPWYDDVRDLARLHLLALTLPHLAGHRILGVAGPAGAQAVMDILRKEFPNANLPTEDPDPVKGGMSKWTVDNSLATNVLGGWVGMGESVVDTARSLGY